MGGLTTSSVGDPLCLTFPVCVFVLLRGVEKEAQTQSGLGINSVYLSTDSVLIHSRPAPITLAFIG